MITLFFLQEHYHHVPPLRITVTTNMVGTVVPESTATSGAAAAAASNPLPSPRPAVSLVESKNKRPAKSSKAARAIRSIFRSFPILSTPAACRFHGNLVPRGAARPAAADGHISGASRTTCTLFGHRRSRCITLAIQESPWGVPIHVLELSVPTGKFMQEMGADHLRVTLECEKNAGGGARERRTKKLLDEPLWAAYVNGRGVGYAVTKEPSERDLEVMQVLYSVSMGAGVLPDDMADAAEGEMMYMRAHFDRMVGNKDSETFYMLSPDGSNGPELTIFFIRV